MYIVIMGVSFMKKFLVLGLALAAISCSSVYAKESVYNFEHGKSVLISSNDNNDVDFKRDGYRHKEFNRDNKTRPDIKGQRDQRKEFGKDNKRPEYRGENGSRRPGEFDKKGNRGPKFDADKNNQKDMKRYSDRDDKFNKNGNKRPDFKNDKNRPEFNKGKDKKQNYKKGNNGNHYGQYKNKSKGHGKNKKNKDKD